MQINNLGKDSLHHVQSVRSSAVAHVNQTQIPESQNSSTVGLGRDLLEIIQSNPSARGGSSIAACPGDFWKSLEKEILQPIWTAYFRIPSPWQPPNVRFTVESSLKMPAQWWLRQETMLGIWDESWKWNNPEESTHCIVEIQDVPIFWVQIHACASIYP